jgi:hypothetical protein
MGGINSWYEQLIDKDVYVVAGSERWGYSNDPQQGLLHVNEISPRGGPPMRLSGCPGDAKGYYFGATGEPGYGDLNYFGNHGGGFYETPGKHGPIHIVGAMGEHIQLLSEDGTKFVFDVGTCHWLLPLVPTTSPIPIYIPPTPHWYDNIETPDTRAYVEKMESTASAVNTAVALTPGTLPPGPPPYSFSAGEGIVVEASITPTSLPAETFRARNYWYEVKGKERITVYAGVEGSAGNRVQGLLAVVVTSADGQRTLMGPKYYRTPQASGYVEILGAESERLQLGTPNGTKFEFDVGKRTWLKP